MANPDHLAILQQGVEAWNEWRRNQRRLVHGELRWREFFVPDLRAADLKQAHLIGIDLDHATLASADLSSAALTEAKLVGADLTSASLARASLRRAMLNGADLTDSNLAGADLMEADLTEACLDGAIFNGADLRGTNVSGTKMYRTVLADADLSAAVGLELVRHAGPSSIGIDTLFRSKGRIPETFLRYAGIPDSLLVYNKSLVGSSIELYSCFISYSTKDQEFAARLYADLQAKSVRCWFAPHDVQGGRKLHEQIDEAIRVHDKLLLILSPNSMASEWVLTEISKARKREMREKARVLFPISLSPFEAIRDWECFDANTGKDSAREIREYYIPDFSNWKDHDAYQKAFDRLLKDLHAASTERNA